MSLTTVTTLGDKRILLPSKQALRQLRFLESEWSEAWLVFGYRMGGSASTIQGAPVIVFGMSDSNGFSQLSGTGKFAGIGASAAAGNLTRIANGSGFKYYTTANSNNNRCVVGKVNGSTSESGNWRDDWHETSRVDGSARVFPVAMKFERLINAIRVTPMVYSDLAALPPTEAEVEAAILAAGGNFATLCTALGGTVGTPGGVSSVDPTDLTHACVAWQPFLYALEVGYVGAWRNPVISPAGFDPLFAFINPAGFVTSQAWKKDFESLTAGNTTSGDSDVGFSAEYSSVALVSATGGTTGELKSLRYPASGSSRSRYRVYFMPELTKIVNHARMTWRLRAPTTGNFSATNGDGSAAGAAWNNCGFVYTADGLTLRTGYTGGATGVIRATVSGVTYTPGEQYQFDWECKFDGANGATRASICRASDGANIATAEYVGNIGATGITNPLSAGAGVGALVFAMSGSSVSDTVDSYFTKLDDVALFLP